MTDTGLNYGRARVLRRFFYWLVDNDDIFNGDKEVIIGACIEHLIECGECSQHATDFLSDNRVTNKRQLYDMYKGANGYALLNEHNTAKNKLYSYDNREDHNDAMLEKGLSTTDVFSPEDNMPIIVAEALRLCHAQAAEYCFYVICAKLGYKCNYTYNGLLHANMYQKFYM